MKVKVHNKFAMSVRTMSVELGKRNRQLDLERQREARSDDYRPFCDDVKVFRKSLLAVIFPTDDYQMLFGIAWRLTHVRETDFG